MKLSELAFACYVYAKMSDYDESYSDFKKCINIGFDFNNKKHVKELLIWLNKWGCRQFAIESHELAAAEICNWGVSWKNRIIEENKSIINLEGGDFINIRKAFSDLANRTAAKKSNGVIATVGPTGAAKILFALFPKALIPWDAAIRTELNHDGTGSSYSKFIKDIQDILNDISRQCKEHGFTMDNLAKIINRPASSLPKLIDEYYWVTISRKCPPPDKELLSKWDKWS